MAGTVTIDPQDHMSVKKYTFTWTCDASGDVSGTHTTVYINGEVLRVVFIPDSGGTQPTNLYDITLMDDSGMDILHAQGTDLSNTTTTDVCPGTPLDDGTTTSVRPVVVADLLELVVANAGNAKGGQVILYVR